MKTTTQENVFLLRELVSALNQSQGVYSSQQYKNQNKKKMHVADKMRGKTHVTITWPSQIELPIG